MGAGKIIAYLAAAILIFFGVLFMWGAGSSSGGGWGWVVIGLLSVGIGFIIIFLASRRNAALEGGNQEFTYKIDLSGDINLDSLKCKSCGGSLSKNNIEMVAGAPVVTCPYCNSSYQLTEEPKW
jgi:DNA-directed RNA polymerase subunit RPC12/RpoP